MLQGGSNREKGVDLCSGGERSWPSCREDTTKMSVSLRFPGEESGLSVDLSLDRVKRQAVRSLNLDLRLVQHL